MYSYSPELVAEERRNMKISGVVTATTTILLLIFSLVWTAYRQHINPPGFKEYELVGAIDFGDYTEGSRKVNNFLPPVENPSETTAPSKATPAPAPTVKPTQAPPILSSNNPSPVTTPSAPKPTTPTPPKPAETKPTPIQPSNNSPTSPSSTSSNQSGTPGSNHGNNESGTGNAGAPDIRTLDPDGLYAFGDGVGGQNGRRPLYLSKLSYQSQQEGRVTFTFKVAPDGSVVSVTAISEKNELKQAGLTAIRSWRFNAVDPSVGLQTLKVTITFKLKG